ncbi:MAG: hypothetical protein ACLT33_10120 [Lachnospira pectinoschiza]
MLLSFIPAVVTFFVTLVIVALLQVVSSKAINKSNDEKIGNANERAEK